MERILIVRLGAMGDIVHGLAAVAELRRAHPQMEIGWLVERRWRELLESANGERSVATRVHLADTRRWRSEPFSRWRELSALRTELRAANYGAVVDLQGALKSAVLARMGGAQRVIGDAHPREGVAAHFYKEKIDTSGAGAHVVQHAAALLSAVAKVEAPARKQEAAAAQIFPVDAQAEQWVDDLLRSRGLARFAVINPGAGWGAKQWPPQRYGQVAAALAECGVRSLVNCGPGEEAIAAQVEQASNAAARKLSASIPQLISLLRRAVLFIGGDTGPMHAANALGTPVVAIFGPTDPARNGPYFLPADTLRSSHSSTSYSHTAQREAGLLEVQAEDVIAASRKLLA